MNKDGLIQAQFGDWTFRYRYPDEPDGTAVILIHGLTGDEDSMWVFSNSLPKRSLWIAPRGTYSVEIGGYSWLSMAGTRFPNLDQFRGAVDRMNDFIDHLDFSRVDFSRVHLVGFSQGAALAFSYAVYYPERIRSIAGLSGFFPENVGQPFTLQDIPVFLAHGSKDELIPIERARQAASILENAGALVTYCEDNVGHKLSSTCYRSLGEFYPELKRATR